LNLKKKIKSTKIEEEKENQPSDSNRTINQNNNFSLHKKFDSQISLYRVKF